MITNNKIIIISRSKSISSQSFLNLGYTVVEPYEYNSRIDYLTRHIAHLLNNEKLFRTFSLYDLNHEFNKINNISLIIIIGSHIYEPFIQRLRNKYPSLPIVYSYSNIVDSKASLKPAILSKYNILGLSWDKEDCKKYNLTYITPGFDESLIVNIKSSKILYDACFIGTDKGRYRIAKKIEKAITNAGLNIYLHITPDYRFLKNIRKDYKEKIPYKRYLEILTSSHCIIDLVQKGQVGPTKRTLEAMFNNKKLISNNETLKEYDFYNPNNIFIISEKNYSDIPEFINTPFIPLSEKILKQYTLKQYINNIQNIINKTND